MDQGVGSGPSAGQTPSYQALHPFIALPIGPNWERFEVRGATVVGHPMPMATPVEPTGRIDDVEATVEAVRHAVRERGRASNVWWLTPEWDHLAPKLQALGLRHEATPGFEAVEHAMVLDHEPDGGPVPGVEVEIVETFEAYADAHRLSARVFGFTDEMVAQMERDLPQRWEESIAPGNYSRGWVARIDGAVVGQAVGWDGPAGINLFAGSVDPDARGRGVYRALTRARWEAAVERGTPALTVQAGAMSKPILERLGFEKVGAARLYVDDL